jgi:hypothetical protein
LPWYGVAQIFTKPVKMTTVLFHVDQYEVVQAGFPPTTRFLDIGGTVDFHAEFPHDFSTQLALRVRRVYQEHSFLLPGSTWYRRGSWHRRCFAHADTAFWFARTPADLPCVLARSSSSWVRFRRAIFCLRSR